MKLLRKLGLKTFLLHQNFSDKISYSFIQFKECAETFFLGAELPTRKPFNLKNAIQAEEMENGEIPTELLTSVVTLLSENTEAKETQGALIGSE